MELVNKIDNKEIYANRAVNDSEGNVIKDTYTKKSDFGFYTDEYGTRLSTVSGNVIDAHWANYAENDINGNAITATYAQKSEIPSTDGLMQESLLSYNDTGKITAYNGSQFVGGGSGPVDWANMAGTAENVQCNNGLINYEATNEDRTGFYVGNYLGNVEVRIADHDNGDVEQWYWDKSGIGCRETKNTWGYYSKLTKDDLQFTTDGGYTPSMSFKDLYSTVSSNSGNWGQGGGGSVQKQQFDHDSTLKHTVNSEGTYVLSVNPTETVLWQGSANNSVTSITLSENVANFEKIRIVFRNNDNYYSSVEIPSDAPKTILNGGYINDANVTFYGKMRNADLNGNVIDIPAAKQIRITSAGAVTVATENAIIVLKVIGVNRIGGNV